MLLYAQMSCFPDYRVSLNDEDVSRNVFLADVERGYVLLRFPGPQGQGFVYEERTGKVKISPAELLPGTRSA